MAIARELLQLCADVDKALLSGETPLFMASQNGHVEVAHLLLEVKADFSISRTDGITPLRVARQRGHLDIVALLESSSKNALLSPR